MSVEKGVFNNPKREKEPSVEKQRDSELLIFLRAEGFDRLKNIDLTVITGEHRSKEDAAIVSEHVAHTDVFLLEFPSWDQETISHLQKCIDGEEDLRKDSFPFSDNTFFDELILKLRGSHVRIASAEVPEHSIEGKEVDESLHLWMNTRAYLRERRVTREEALGYVEFALAQAVKAHGLREKYIAEHIGPAIVRALPEQDRNKEALQASLFIGSGHTSVVPRLRAIHQETARISIDSNYVMTFESEAIRRSLFGLTVSPEHVDAVLTEYTLEAMHLNAGEDAPQGEKGKAYIMRSFIPQLNAEERNHLYEAIVLRDNREEASEYLESLVETKNMKVPDGLFHLANRK